MIEIRDLHKDYDGLEVLKGIDLKIDRGKIFGLAGRSGSGKSTLLRCINGLESYSRGTLLLDGVDIKELSPTELRDLRRKVGMIFQNFSLLQRLTVYDNIALPMSCWGYSKQEIKQKVHYLLDVVELTDKIKAKPRELSGGQKQRVAIARALSLDPELLLCDEATSALDPRTTSAILKLLRKINQELNITMIVVSHQMEVIKSICDEIAVIENGRVEASGEMTEIMMNKPQALLNLLGDRNLDLPSVGKNIEVYMFRDMKDFPLVSEIATKLKVPCAIIGGEFGNGLFDSLIINVADSDAKKVENYLVNMDFKWNYIAR